VLCSQVLDTPGILDHPLEERNTIEMLSITALAHLRAAIIFVIDISEQCSYSIEDQVKLFNSIKPLFTNKPLVVALNKIDVITLENLREDARALLRDLETQNNVYLIPMSTLTEEGVMNVKEFVRPCLPRAPGSSDNVLICFAR
jgi:nucleolar GTP-binding protein